MPCARFIETNKQFIQLEVEKDGEVVGLPDKARQGISYHIHLFQALLFVSKLYFLYSKIFPYFVLCNSIHTAKLSWHVAHHIRFSGTFYLDRYSAGKQGSGFGQKFSETKIGFNSLISLLANRSQVGLRGKTQHGKRFPN